MSVEFQNLIQTVSEAIEGRTIIFGESKNHKMLAARHFKGEFNPVMSIVKRGDGIKCVWGQNKAKSRIFDGNKTRTVTEPEIGRICLSKCNEGLTSEEWNKVTLDVMHGLGLKL